MAKIVKGVKVPSNKNTRSQSIVQMPAPPTVRVSMVQHMGAPCVPVVKRGDEVKIGQLIGDSEAYISAPIHASVSGTVKRIGESLLPNGVRTQSIEIESDGEDALLETLEAPKFSNHEEFVQAVRDSGLVGLGGAGFPTHVKMNPPHLDQVKTLIVNAVECEPYITSDYRMMMERTDDLFYAIDVTMKMLELDKCYIGIEGNKPNAIAYLENRLKEMGDQAKNIEISVLPVMYPQGAEKILIYNVMDGLVVEEGNLPADHGVLVQNVSTMVVLGRYLQDGVPLTHKCMTIDGSAVADPKNIMAPIGTSVADMMEFAGGYQSTPRKIYMGGPMMGYAVRNEDFTLLKQNNAFVALDASEVTRYEETPCISCGRCMRVCPMNLMPSYLKEAADKDNMEMLETLKVNLCMECGACAYTCPARQELTQTHRLSKARLAQHLAEQADQ